VLPGTATAAGIASTTTTTATNQQNKTLPTTGK